MSLQPKARGITEPQAACTQAETVEVSVGNSVRDEQISRRATEIRLERGEEPCRDLDDWFQAERELERGVLRRAQAAWEANPPKGGESAAIFYVAAALRTSLRPRLRAVQKTTTRKEGQSYRRVAPGRGLSESMLRRK